MSLYISDDGIIGGERINPPEYASDNPGECSKCGYFIDLDDDSYLTLDNGDLRCDDCSETCQGCGERITDYGKAINLRDYISGRIEAWCAECACIEWVERIVRHHGESSVRVWPDADDLSAEQIAELYRFYTGAL